VLEPQPSLRRLALALAIGVAALVQVHAFVQTLHSQARQRERVVREEKLAIQGAAPRLARAFETGDPERVRETLREIIVLSQIAEVELYTRLSPIPARRRSSTGRPRASWTACTEAAC
jgi:hypothetical protein